MFAAGHTAAAWLGTFQCNGLFPEFGQHHHTRSEKNPSLIFVAASTAAKKKRGTTQNKAMSRITQITFLELATPRGGTAKKPSQPMHTCHNLGNINAHIMDNVKNIFFASSSTAGGAAGDHPKQCFVVIMKTTSEHTTWRLQNCIYFNGSTVKSTAGDHPNQCNDNYLDINTHINEFRKMQLCQLFSQWGGRHIIFHNNDLSPLFKQYQ